MASVQDVTLDFVKTNEKTTSKISLKLEFSSDELADRQQYGLYTAIISDADLDDHVFTSPHCGYEDYNMEQDDEDQELYAMEWIDTRTIRAKDSKVLHLQIENNLKSFFNTNSRDDFRAVVYLIPERKTSFAWSAKNNKKAI